MNSVNILGRACATPTLKYVGQDNHACAEFTLAVDSRHGPKDANGKRKTLFFAIVAWGKTAETLSGYLVKGQQIGITGRLAQEEFVPKGTDKPVQKTRIVCEAFTFGAKPQGHTASNASDQATDAKPATDDEPDNIPF